MMDYEHFFSRVGESMRESAIRKMGSVLADARDMISFAPGYPSEEVFPWADFREISQTLLSGDDGGVLQYGATRGYRPLIEFLVDLMASRSITTSPNRLIVTSGSQQGLDIVARVLLDPGDVVLVELPSYTGAITAFRNVGAELVGVRQDRDGLDLDHLEATLARLRGAGRRVNVLYVVPNFQNPTGLLVGLVKRRQLVAWASRHDLLIVEDDPYRDLYFPDVTGEQETRAMAADDPEGRVVYLSSFSKTLAPGFRVAWLHAPPALSNKFELAKQAEDLCNGGLDQRIVYEACRRGVLTRQLPLLRRHYQHKRDVMVAALNAMMPGSLTWEPPRGGFFLWARLAEPLDGDGLLPLAQARGVIYVAGSAFFVSGQEQRFIRLCFSSPTPERIREGVRRLADAVRDAARPAMSARSASPAG